MLFNLAIAIEFLMILSKSDSCLSLYYRSYSSLCR